MTALLTAFASTSTSALACRDALASLRTAYQHLAASCTQEIQQVASMLEGIPASAVVGQHCGAVGSAMAGVHEATRTARTLLTTHMLELEFVSHEAATLAQGVGGLSESFPLPALAPSMVDANRPKEHNCDRCEQPVEPFAACSYCDPSNEEEPSQGEAEHLIAAIHKDIDNGIAKPHGTTAEERSRKLDQELAAVQADLDRLPSSIGVSGLNDPSNQAALARLEDSWEQETQAANPPAGQPVPQPKKTARTSRKKK